MNFNSWLPFCGLHCNTTLSTILYHAVESSSVVEVSANSSPPFVATAAACRRCRGCQTANYVPCSGFPHFAHPHQTKSHQPVWNKQGIILSLCLSLFPTPSIFYVVKWGQGATVWISFSTTCKNVWPSFLLILHKIRQPGSKVSTTSWILDSLVSSPNQLFRMHMHMKNRVWTPY